MKTDTAFLELVIINNPENALLFTDEITVGTKYQASDYATRRRWNSKLYKYLPDYMKKDLEVVKSLTCEMPKLALAQINLGLFDGEDKETIIEYLRKGELLRESVTPWPSDK